MPKLTFSSAGSDPNALVYKGSWVTATSYSKNNQVGDNGDLFVCILTHTSAAGSEPGVGVDWTDYWARSVDMLTADQIAAAAGTGTPSGSNTFVTADHTGLTDARTPVAHNQAASTVTAGTFPTGTFSFTDTQTIPLLSSEIVPTFTAGAVTLTTAQCANTMVSNYNQSEATTITLPSAATGMTLVVTIITTGYALHIKPGASDKIYWNGTALDDGDKLSLTTPAVGNAIAIFSFKSGTTTHDWFATDLSGTWVDGGA